MNETDIQRQSEQGDEHADDLTFEQAVEAVRRCQFSRRVALTNPRGWDTLGEDDPIIVVSFQGVTVEVLAAEVEHSVASADRIWWQPYDTGTRLAYSSGGDVFTLTSVYPRRPPLCGYCAKHNHPGACDIDDSPSYRASNE